MVSVIRLLIAVCVAWLTATAAQAQTSPLGSGFSFANGTLFVPAITVLKTMAPPFGYSYNFKATATPSSSSVGFINTSPLTANVGFFSGYVFGGSDSYHFKNYWPTASNSQGANCQQVSYTINRWPALANGNLHNVCVIWTDQNRGSVYIDGYLTDQTYLITPFISS